MERISPSDQSLWISWEWSNPDVDLVPVCGEDFMGPWKATSVKMVHSLYPQFVAENKKKKDSGNILLPQGPQKGEHQTK